MTSLEISPSDLPYCDVVVIGAGLAGLAAADTLTRAGATVMVFEGRNRVGGRALSIGTREGAVELGATWFWPNEPEIATLATDLEVETFEQSLEGDALFETTTPGAQRLDGNPIDAPSSRFTRGVQPLLEQLANRLACGTLRLTDPVHALTVTGRGVVVEAESTSMLAGQVILALPPSLAVESIRFTPALPEEIQDLARSTAVWMGSVVKAVALYESPFWRDESLSGSAISYAGPFRELHDHSGPTGAPAALFGFAPAGALEGLSSQEMQQAFLEQLTRLFGVAAADPLSVHLQDWSREAFTSPVHPHPSASPATFGDPRLSTPIHRRLHLASTEVDDAFAGHLEGALRAGHAAARRVLTPSTHINHQPARDHVTG